MKHTPGPWEVASSDYLYVIRRQPGTAELTENPAICCCFSMGARYPEEIKANARLIAAAPELLAVCEEALREVVGFTARTGIPQFSPWIGRTRAVIAKAKEG